LRQINDLTLEVTNKCNLSCKYCYVWPFCEKQSTLGEIEAALKSTSAFYFPTLFLSGGEPFLRKDIGSSSESSLGGGSVFVL
jgi:MoaA/NifB/PqqE/SkfB family radical SAM enzyme